MAKTFTICCYLLLALGIAVSAWLCPHPLMFAPYLILAFVIRDARRFIIRAFVLAYTLSTVCVSFWFCWDAAFIHLSTLNLMPPTVAMVEALATGVTWFVVRSIERRTVPQHVA